MKKTIVFAAVAVTALAGAALAQTTTPGGPVPAPVTPSATMPSTPPSATMPSSAATATPSPGTAAAPSTAMPTRTVLIDRQKVGEALSSELIGASVHVANGDRIGDVNDLVIDGTGRVSGVVIGVGGFLGVGEKNVAVDYATVVKGRDDNGRTRLTVHLSAEALKAAAPFVPVEKS